MYEFATITLLGLAVATVVELAGYARPVSRAVRAVLALVAGLAIAWATDYSAFAGWGVHFRSLWMGPVATGLAIAGIAALWHTMFTLLGSYARRASDQASDIETHIPRAA
jgi:hypothetical protein